MIWRTRMTKCYISDGGHSAVLRTLSFGSLTLAQIPQGETSHIPGTLSEMPAVALMEDDKDVEFG